MALLCPVTLLACTAPAPDLSQEEQAVATVSHTWPTTQVPVCFDEVRPEQAEAAQWIREAVTETYQRVSAVELIGWAECTPNEPGIHVGFGGGTGAAGRGTELDGMIEGISIAIEGASSDRVHADAVRTFEQGLGGCFESYMPLDAGVPEIDVPGKPCTWSQDFVPTWPFELAGEVAWGLHAWYGANPGNLVFEGRCEYAATAFAVPGLVGCDDSPEATFRHTQPWAPPRYQVPLGNDRNLCIAPSLPNQPSALTAEPCTGSSPTWSPADSTTIEGTGGDCIAYHQFGPWTYYGMCRSWVGPDIVPDVQVGYPSWFGFAILDENGTRCMVPDFPGIGANMVMQSCGPDGYFTKWIWNSSGQLQHFATGLCLELDDADIATQRLRLHVCGTTLRQRWNLATKINLDNTNLFLAWWGERAEKEWGDWWRYFP